jgi:hypothetical protein
MKIKTREPGSAFLKQVATPQSGARRQRSWREVGHDEKHAVSIDSQTEHKADTNQTQTEHKADTNQTQTEHKADTKPNTLLDTKRTQIRHKANTNVQFEELTGLQRHLTIFVYRSCQKERSKVSAPLTIEYVSDSLQCQAGSVKTSFKRLEDKMVLNRHSFKSGRSGWTRYNLSDELFQTLLQFETENKLDTNRTQTGHKLDTKPDTKPDTNFPSSSSSKILNTKTTTTQDFESDAFGLSGVWREIDQTPLTDQGCPFGPSQIRQARSFGMSPEALQESVYNFGWALMQNWQPPGGFKSSPLNFFMGCLRSNGLYEHENYYRQKRERAEIEKRWLEECRRKEQEPSMPDADTFIAEAQSGLDLTEFKS